MIDIKNAIEQLQELADEHHERASRLSCVPFCNTDWAVEAGIAAAYDNAVEILTKNQECSLCRNGESRINSISLINITSKWARYDLGRVDDVRFCPCCGRRLKESKNETHKDK